MYIILVAPSGIRKGTILGPGRKMLRELSDIHLAAEAITREALIREIANSESQMLISDTKLGPIQCALTIYSMELTVFLGQNNWQLMSDLNDWFDCTDPWTYRTKNVGTDEINGICVNLIGGTTPEFLQSALPQDAIGGGLAGRIMFVYGDKKSHVEPFPFLTKEEKDLEEDLVHDLHLIHSMHGQFTFTEEFLMKYHTWYLDSEANPPFRDKNLVPYNQRRSLHLRKLCMALSAARSNEMIINGFDFDMATALMLETEAVMPHVFAGRGRVPHTDIMNRILVYLVNSKSGELSRKQILQDYYKDITPDELDRMIATLDKIGACKIVHTGTDVMLVYTPERFKEINDRGREPAVQQSSQDDNS